MSSKSQVPNSHRDVNNPLVTLQLHQKQASKLQAISLKWLLNSSWKFTSNSCLTCPMLHVLQQVKENSAVCSHSNYKPSPFNLFLNDLIMLGDWAKMTDECAHKKYTVVNLNLSSALSDCELLLRSAEAKSPGDPGEACSWFQDLCSTLHCHRSCTTHHIWYISRYKTPKR